MQWDFAAHTTQVIPSETMSLIQLLFALGSGPICTHKERGRGLPRLLWLINQKPQSELLTSLSMLCSHIMQYTCFTLLIMTRRHCGGLVWAVLNCLWCFMHGPAVWCVFKRGTERAACSASLWSSVGWLGGKCWPCFVANMYQCCPLSFNSNVYCWLKSALILMVLFKGVTGEILVCLFVFLTAYARLRNLFVVRTPRERFICAKCSLAFCLF